ncbi:MULTISPECIES: ParB/RepB/Spo0J family partition protein [unclassified Azospirillum]|uniref:ParB/RepB/Spo0J family partition protein n=1 Tax=unclassified Azospirillum TaxID=2630922 RepID=UPI000D659C46|nr:MULTISPECIES: ParB/RepB/Spo0J family partition protein [unclassified Azospirillum]
MSTPATTRAAIAAAAFANLRAAVGEGRGEVLTLPIAAIDEDPGQPRRQFDADELASLAASIKSHGLVQPVVVRPAIDGRYQLVVGARRLRASKLAGLTDIPAVLRPADGDVFAAQLIENQQRAPLPNSDLAAAIARLTEAGQTIAQIAALCALKEYQVSAFRQVDAFPPALRQWLDHADIRALYELYRQWRHTPDALLAALPTTVPADGTPLTVTEARRLIARLSGASSDTPSSEPPSSTTGSRTDETTHRTSPTSTVAAGPQQPRPGQATRPKPAEPSSSLRHRPPEAAQPVPVFLVAAADGRTGRLVADRRADRAGAALVAYDEELREVEASVLRIVAVI